MNNELNTFIHPLSDVKTKNIGQGTRIWQYCVILENAVIGENCNICSHCFIENKVKIGHNTTIKNGVFIYDECTIGDNVFIGPNVSFTNDKYPVSKNYQQQYEPIIIKNGASIGAGAILLPNIIIGENAIIGAGAIITKNVADGAKIKGKY